MTRLVRVLVTLAVMVGAAVFAVGSPAHAASTLAIKRNDYNRDGISDLVAINQNTGCLWRWNGTSAGSLAAGVQVGCGWDPYSVIAAVGDINRDGVGDLVAVNNNTGCLWRWQGSGNGGFFTGQQIGSCTWGDVDNLVGAGDLNGDGVGDLLGTASFCLFRWYGNGSGGFGPSTLMDCSTDNLNYLTGVGDDSGDGKADIVGIADSDQPWIYFGNGTGGFRSGIPLGYPWPTTLDAAGMGDMNRDGRGDVLSVDFAGGDYMLCRRLGDGAGGFGYCVYLGGGWEPYNLIG